MDEKFPLEWCINKKKLVTVAWHKSCKPLKEGGLGIRNLSNINEAGNLKLCWEIVQSDLPWASFVRSRVLRNKKPIRYHISSSIWSSAKHKLPTILNNTSWQLGNGELINFWCDNWCKIPFVDLFNIPPHLHSSLQSTVSQFINNNNWCVPQDILQVFPNLQQSLNLVSIPLIQKEDKFIWKKSHDGNLSFKDAYIFQSASNHQHPSWSKIIWNAAIPPSKSLLTWRILHEKMPTDEHLIQRGCQIPYICSMCALASESSVHLFLECNFAQQIWNWLRSILNINFNLTSFFDPLKAIDRNWSPQWKVVILAAIISCYNTIWFCRNQKRYQEKIINIRTAKNLIISSTNMAGNLTTLSSRASMSEFVILKHFDVKVKPPEPQIIKEVVSLIC